MRFQSLDTVVFGPLRERAFELDSDIVLVHGRNEAGKSSFRAAIETILYGFKPADRDSHPLVQWKPEQSENLHLEAELRLDTDELHGVERVLLATGKSRLATGTAAFSGPRRGNTCLPWVAWLPREIFAALYSLEISQLAALDASVRGDVDELLLPTPSGLPLRSLAEVRSELRREHTELWRPDKRGKPQARKLRTELVDARTRAAQAEDAERELRQARAERAEREAQLEQLRDNKRELDRVHADAPVLGALFEHEVRRRRLGAPIDLTGLGDYPLVAPSALLAEIRELEERLAPVIARLERPPVELRDSDAAVAERAPDVEHAIAELPRWQADTLRGAEQTRSAQAMRERGSQALAGALNRPPEAADIERAGHTPMTALRALEQRWSEHRESEAIRSQRASNRIRLGAFGLGVLGILGVASGSLALPPPAPEWLDPRIAERIAQWWAPVPVGLGLLGLSLLLSLLSRPARRAEDVAVREQLSEMLDGLDVAPALLDDPHGLQRLIAAIDSAQQFIREAQAAERIADEIDDETRTREQRWTALCERLRLDASGNGELLVARLRDAFESARRSGERVRDDGAERAEAERLRDRDAPQLARKIEHARCLEQTLRGAAPESRGLDEAYERVCEQRAEREFLHRREAELRADPRFAAFEGDARVLADRAPDDAPWRPDVSAAREARIEDLEQQIGAQQRRLGELDELLGNDAGHAFARASDEVRALEDELAQTERRRDRLALLETILARAERDFREDHQPDVLRRASVYLNRVTQERYQRIDLIDEGDGGLCVSPAERSEPIAVGEPLSQGTLDQIFLCLRLGLLDHLDADRQPLPLILDDALLRMDDDRRHAVYSVLGEIAPRRQIFLLTCHASVADEIEHALKVQRIDL